MSRRIQFFSGKGGVGKTSIAAARAVQLSGSSKVLLVSIDPAHNLSDLFQAEIGSEITSINNNLYLLELDAEQEAHRYLEEVKDNLSDKVRPELVKEVHRHIDSARYSPGANESALFDRITRLILEESEDYDYVIFDTAPTGHTLRLMTLPELMGLWVDGLIGRRKAVDDTPQWVRDGREEDPVLEKLNERKARFSRVREYIQDGEYISFWFVAIPERLSVLETRRAVKELTEHGIPVGGLIINKVLKGQSEDRFYRDRSAAQQPYIEELRQISGISEVCEIPLLDRDIDTPAMFERFCEIVSGEVGE